MHPDLELALRLADAADAITMDRFQASDLKVETKPDMTPVTEADKAVEEALRRLIAADRPEHGIVGEEFGSQGSTTARWILDPIDATKNYARGIPMYATLIALEIEGTITTGVVSAPALSRRWWAQRGDGAYLNSSRIAVSRVANLNDALVTYTSIKGDQTDNWRDRLLSVVDAGWMDRGYGDFWQHMLVAEGRGEVALEPVANLWDLAAPKVIVEEAGGRMTDFNGTDTADGGNALTTNGLLHDAVLTILGSA